MESTIESHHGFVGMGTWETIAEYRNIRVVTAGKSIAQAAPGTALSSCHITRGDWEVIGNIIRQSSSATDTALHFGGPE